MGVFLIHYSIESVEAGKYRLKECRTKKALARTYPHDQLKPYASVQPDNIPNISSAISTDATLDTTMIEKASAMNTSFTIHSTVGCPSQSISEFVRSFTKTDVKERTAKTEHLNLPETNQIHQFNHFNEVSAPFSIVTDMQTHEEDFEQVLTILMNQNVFNENILTKRRDNILLLTALLTYSYKSSVHPLSIIDTLLEKPTHLKDTPRGRKKVSGKLMIGDNSVEKNDLITLDGSAWLNDKVKLNNRIHLLNILFPSEIRKNNNISNW